MDVEMEDNGCEEQLKARPYQEQLEEIAMRKNTIIHLPTGSGKTYIAIRVITRLRAAIQKPWGEGGKRTFFLVNNIPLVDQQRNMIERRCPVDGVAGYSGEDRVDYWNKDKWDEELSKHQVIVMTSQILNDMLTHQYIRIEDINLLIFDECHHAVVDHPMRLIMKKFEDCPKHKQPRVIGLSATLLNANAGSEYKIEQYLKDLETTFHATIATVDEFGEVLKYSTNPYEMVQYYQTPVMTRDNLMAIKILNEVSETVCAIKLPRIKGDANIQLRNDQQDISHDPRKVTKAVDNMITAMINNIGEFGTYGGSVSIVAYTILLERLKRKASSKEEAALFKIVITAALCARDILERSMENETGFDKIKKHSSEQMLQLLSILREYNPAVYNNPAEPLRVNRSRQPLSGIIFTRQRFTAKILYNILKEVRQCNPEYQFLQHDFITGFNVNPFNCTREQVYLKKTSQTALLKFCNKELNCMIATSVIEEGVDIPQCLLVVRYDPPLEYRSYIQSKGRARSADASYVILNSADTRDKFQKKYASFQETERYIQKLLIGETENRLAPSSRMLQHLYEEDEVPPYMNKYGGRLSAVQSISLLNRYCSVLPHDQFTTISLMWISEDGPKPGQTVITIMMPLACPVKESIKGDPYYNVKSAKRSAAMKACIKLHEAGELDAVTMLPKHYSNVNYDEEEMKQCFPNWPWDDPDTSDIVSSKRERKYKKAFPACLDGPQDWHYGQQNFYLHVIHLKAAFDKPKESRELALYEFLHKNEGFGFLTTKPLPKLCDFPMFLTVGEVTTSVEVNYAILPLSKDMFELVKRFHLYIFEQVLDVARKFLVFDGTVNALYVVPVHRVNGLYGVDWAEVNELKEVKPIAPPSYEERRNLRVTRESYKHSIITPWYRSTIMPDRYVVSDVLEYLTPQSHFGHDREGSERYEDYYNTRYNLEIVGQKDQPLLEVRNISTRMNCLMPRAVTLKTITDKQKKLIANIQGDDKPQTKNTYQEILIPEYCIKYEFSGVLWYKACMLPSIVHRVLMILAADELRSQIARDTGIGVVELPRGHQWQPISLDLHIATKALLSLVEAPSEINTIDRINNPIDESLPRPVNIASMKEVIYQLQKKKLNQDYPWDETSEPVDIERNILTVTVMDVECYDEFVCAALVSRDQTAAALSPLRARTSPQRAAILPPPLTYKENINMLTQAPSQRGPELKDVLAALTVIKSGDTFNLERAETLGDSFLKFAATLYLFHKFPQCNEGQLTNIKGRLIGNRNLYYAGARVNLGGRMKLEQFGPRKDFLVPGFLAPKELREQIEEMQIRPTILIGVEFSRPEMLSGCLSADSRAAMAARLADSSSGQVEPEPPHAPQGAMQAYVAATVARDKTIADCVEALIGTYLLSSGIPGAVKVLEWFRILPKEDNFKEYLHKPVPTALSMGKIQVDDIDYLLNNCRIDIERKLNYTFRDPTFLLEALSHPSYIRNRHTRSYERLEFLGDAVLDLLITAHCFEHCRTLRPGELTDLRSALVNNVTFAAYVVKLGLHKYICYQLNSLLDQAIMSFVEHQQQRGHEIVEDVLYLIDEDECHIAQYVEVPKVLSDIFESLAGAIYLDSGGSLAAVWSVFYRVMWREVDAFSNNIPKQPVRLLHENVHACPRIGTPIVMNTDIPKIMVPVTISKNGVLTTVHGVGNNKSQAKRAAAKLALKVLAL
ncbi:hypothetical protein JYU34_017404 [Plutella xylostella]|uniref:Dicer-2 n=1 Tax=Plutella xylostella TaxID=51655 RepID=A0ABQ7Q144_PLUXY|nr:hypothetical protein JYU34_017404 [Plutella xylostella]